MASPVVPSSSPIPTASAYQRPTYGRLKGRSITINDGEAFFPIPSQERDASSLRYAPFSRAVGLVAYSLLKPTDSALRVLQTFLQAPAASRTTQELARSLIQADQEQQKQVVEKAKGVVSWIPFLQQVAHPAAKAAGAALSVFSAIQNSTAALLSSLMPVAGRAIAVLRAAITDPTQRYFAEVLQNPDVLSQDLSCLLRRLQAIGTAPAKLLACMNSCKGVLYPFPLPEHLSLGHLELFLQRSRQEKDRMLDEINSNIMRERISQEERESWRRAIVAFHSRPSDETSLQQARMGLKDMFAFYVSIQPTTPLPRIDQLHVASIEELVDTTIPKEERVEKLRKAILSLRTPLKEEDRELLQLLPNFSPCSEGDTVRIAQFIEQLEKDLLEKEFASLGENGKQELEKMVFAVSASTYWNISESWRRELQQAIDSLTPPSTPTHSDLATLKTLYAMFHAMPKGEHDLIVTPQFFETLPPQKQVRLFQIVNKHATSLSDDTRRTLARYSSLRSFADWNDLPIDVKKQLMELVCREYSRMPQSLRQEVDKFSFQEVRLLPTPYKARLFELIRQKLQGDSSLLSHPNAADLRRLLEQYAEGHTVEQERQIIRLAKRVLTVEDQIVMQGELDSLHQYAKFDRGKLQEVLLDTQRELQEATGETRQPLENQKKLIESILDTIDQAHFQPEEARQPSRELPTQRVEGPALAKRALRPIDRGVVTQGTLHQIGRAAGAIPRHLMRGVGIGLGRPIQHTKPFVPLAWQAVRHYMSTERGSAFAAQYLSWLSPDLEARLQTGLKALVDIPLQLSSHLKGFLHCVQQAKEAAQARGEETALLTQLEKDVQAMRAGISTHGRQYNQSMVEALLQRCQSMRARLTQSLQREQRQEVFSQAAAFKREARAAKGLPNTVLSWFGLGGLWRPSKENADLAQAATMGIQAAKQQERLFTSLEAVQTYQQKHSVLGAIGSAAGRAAGVAQDTVGLIGINLHLDLLFQTAQFGLTCFQATATTARAIHSTTGQVVDWQQRLISLAGDVTSQSLTNARRYLDSLAPPPSAAEPPVSAREARAPQSTDQALSLSAQSRSGLHTALSIGSHLLHGAKLLIPAALVATTGGSAHLTTALLRYAVPKLMDTIGPERASEFVASLGRGWEWGWTEAGTYVGEWTKSRFDDMQARFNSWRGKIDQRRLQSLREFGKEERSYLLEVLEYSSIVQKARADSPLARDRAMVFNKANRERFTASDVSGWTEEEQTSYLTALLTCYNAVSPDEQKNLTPTLLLSLPGHVQNRIREIVRGEGRAHRTDFAWICRRYNALPTEQKERVHHLSVNEFWLLASETQKDLLAILITSSLSEQIPPPRASSYEKYLACQRLSRKELAPILALYSRVAQADFAILTPSQIRSLPPGKLAHAIEILDSSITRDQFLSSLRRQFGNISWFQSMSTLKAKVEEIAKKERRGESIPPLEKKLWEQVVEHIALVFSQRETRESIRHEFLQLTDHELNTMSEREIQEFVRSLRDQLREENEHPQKVQDRKGTIESNLQFLNDFLERPNFSLNHHDTTRLLQIFNGPSTLGRVGQAVRQGDYDVLSDDFRSAVRLRLAEKAEYYRKQEELLTQDIGMLDRLYESSLADHVTLQLSAGHFLNEELQAKDELEKVEQQLTHPPTDPTLLEQKHQLEEQRDLNKQAKQRRLQEIEAHQKGIDELKASRNRKVHSLELQGHPCPPLPTSLSDNKVREISGLFRSSTERAMADSLLEPWKEELQQDHSIAGVAEKAKQRLSDLHRSSAEAERKEQTLREQLVRKKAPLTDPEKEALEAYTHRVLITGEQGAREVFGALRKEYLETFYSHLSQLISKEGDYRQIETTLQSIPQGDLSDEEKRACLQLARLSLLEKQARIPKDDMEVFLQSKEYSFEAIQRDIQAAVEKEQREPPLPEALPQYRNKAEKVVRLQTSRRQFFQTLQSSETQPKILLLSLIRQSKSKRELVDMRGALSDPRLKDECTKRLAALQKGSLLQKFFNLFSGFGYWFRASRRRKSFQELIGKAAL